MSTHSPVRGTTQPDLSLIIPCYNEQECVRGTIRQLFAAFREAGHQLEIVAVDNGSADRTGEILRSMAELDPWLVCERVEVNQGYGNGVLQGVPACNADWVGIIPADGQVDASDVVYLFESAAASQEDVVAKVRRRFRLDGLWRKLVSVIYNLLVLLLWPGIGSLDINGSPKILPRRVIRSMALESRGWFLDAEIMIKAYYLGLRVIEFNVFARMRGSGTSHVRVGTCWEFLRNVLRYRFSPSKSRARLRERQRQAAGIAA
jgi:glycosyltransferase involved in cell wall biosynthesis